MRARTSVITILVAAAVVAAADLARAQSSAAGKYIYELARKQMADGNYGVACPAFAESQRLDPRPGTLLTLAVCHDRWGKVATAVATFEDFRRELEKMPPAARARYDERARKADLRRSELLPLVPTLTLSLPSSAPAGVEIERNGVPVSAASLDVPIPMDPGEHVITTQVGNGPLVERRITLERGESKTVTLEVKLAEREPDPPRLPPPALPTPPAEPEPEARIAAPAPVKAPTPAAGSSLAAAPPARSMDSHSGRLPPPAPSITGRRIGALFAGGLGLAGLALGTVTGVIVLQKKSVVQEHCHGLTCDPEGKAAADSATLPGALSTVGFGVGAAGIAAGLILWLTEPPAPPASPVWSGAGPTAPPYRTGMMVGAKGAW